MATEEVAVQIVLAHNSSLFREFIADFVSKLLPSASLVMVTNGAAALEKITESTDLVIVAAELPLYDGRDILHHCVEQDNGPSVIVVSSLSGRESFRAFDFLKAGATYFCSEAEIRDLVATDAGAAQFLSLLINSSAMENEKEVRRGYGGLVASSVSRPTVVFCEECGSRNKVDPDGDSETILCAYCGDTIRVVQGEKSVANPCSTMILGGIGAVPHIFSLLSALPEHMPGALCIVIDCTPSYVDALVKYLQVASLVPVLRVTGDNVIEGGRCYIFSSHEKFYLKKSGTVHKFITFDKRVDGIDKVDLFLASAFKSFLERSLVVLLPQQECLGQRALVQFARDEGLICELDERYALFSWNLPEETVAMESSLAELIRTVHEFHLKSDVIRMG